MHRIASEAYLRKRGRSSNAGEVPYFFPKLGVIIDTPLAKTPIIFKLYVVLLLNGCLELMGLGGLWTRVLPELFRHWSRHPGRGVQRLKLESEPSLTCAVSRDQQAIIQRILAGWIRKGGKLVRPRNAGWTPSIHEIAHKR